MKIARSRKDYTIIILGGNIMQLPAIRIAKEQGWRVIVADRNSAVPGVALADVFEPVDLKDIEGMLQMARKYASGSGLDGIFTAGTDFSATVAYVAEKLNLPGIPYAVALKATDKALMRAAFRAAGVPSPGFVKLQKGDDPLSVLQHLSFPLVIKPVDNMGARGIRRLDSPEELPTAFANALDTSRSGQVILEEFLPGEEYSIDALVEKGQIHICGVADRHIFFPPYFVEMGHTIPTCLEPAKLQELLRVFKAGVKALGITLGAAKGDIFYTPRGAVIGEIAARLSGGYMSGWTYPFASGIEPTRGALNLAVGLPAGLNQAEQTYTSAERAFISIPGRIKQLDGTAEVKNQANVMELFCLIGPGSEVKFPTNNVEKCGNIITRCKTRSGAIAAAQKALKTIHIHLQADHPQTTTFLLGQGPSAQADIRAFSLKVAENHNTFNRMQPYYWEPDEHGGYEDPAVWPERNRDDRWVMKILDLPHPSREQALDWHGYTLEESIAVIRTYWPEIDFVPAPVTPGLTLGRIFWQTLLRGGYQGGLYILTTLYHACKTNQERNIKLTEWTALLEKK